MVDDNEVTVSRNQLAKELGVSQPYISRIVKEGRFDDCLTPDGKRLYLAKALAKYDKTSQKARKKPQKVKKTTQKGDLLDGETITIHQDGDAEVYNTDNKEQLKALLRETESPMHRAQIESTFWHAKTRQLAFLEKERDLIPITDVKTAVDSIFSPINRQLDDLPVQFKGNFPEVSEEAVQWLLNQIDTIKQNSAHDWGTI